MARWNEISAALDKLRSKENELLRELEALREKCNHSKLPKRAIGESYMDKCPDCGYIAYCYEIW